jgi:hypothetical protein
LGDTYDPAMLDYAERSTYERPDASYVQPWRRKEDARAFGLTEPLFGDLLTRRGYEPSGHPPIDPGPAERVALWLGNKRAIWSRRIERFGLRDPLLVAIGRRLKLPALVKPAQQRIDEATREILK